MICFINFNLLFNMVTCDLECCCPWHTVGISYVSRVKGNPGHFWILMVKHKRLIFDGFLGLVHQRFEIYEHYKNVLLCFHLFIFFSIALIVSVRNGLLQACRKREILWKHIEGMGAFPLGLPFSCVSLQFLEIVQWTCPKNEVYHKLVVSI